MFRFPICKETTHDKLDKKLQNKNFYFNFEYPHGSRCRLLVESDTYARYVTETLSHEKRIEGNFKNLAGSILDCYLYSKEFYIHDCIQYKSKDMTNIEFKYRKSYYEDIVKQINAKHIKNVTEVCGIDKKAQIIIKGLNSKYIEGRPIWTRSRPNLIISTFITGITREYIRVSVLDECGGIYHVAHIQPQLEELQTTKLLKNPKDYMGLVIDIEQTGRDSYSFYRLRRDKHFTNCINNPDFLGE